MTEDILTKLKKNEIRTVSRLMSLIENGQSDSEEIMNMLYAHAQQAIRIGVTGPPGAGKSTLSDGLIKEFRSEGKTVGVITVDPTSPFSGGAFLGDRIRMNKHSLDEGVFIRSMGSRGYMGGLARTSHYLADIIACTGKDYILFETVGVGQAEVEIVENVDITIVILVPESGDEIQVIKAGLVEIGDIFIVNKSDREGANRITQLINDYLEKTSLDKEFIPEVIQTVATEGRGIKELFHQCNKLLQQFKNSGTFKLRRLEQYKTRVRNAVREELEKYFWTKEKEALFQKELMYLKQDNLSPIKAARQLIKNIATSPRHVGGDELKENWNNAP